MIALAALALAAVVVLCLVQVGPLAAGIGAVALLIGAAIAWAE